MAARGCFVTGSGRGLGAALTLDLLEQGAFVVALSRQRVELEELRRVAIERGLANRLFLEVGSTLDPIRITSGISQLHAHGCELNLFIANASVFGPRELLTDCSPVLWEDAVTTNILGLSRSCRAAIPALKKAQHSQILVIGSGIGHRQSCHASAYAVSKLWLGLSLSVLALN